MSFRKLTIPLVFATTMTSMAAQATTGWGYGLYGGMQSCGYQSMVGEGASSYLDEIKELAQQIKDTEKEITSKKSEKRKAESEIRKLKFTMERSLNTDGMDIINSHVDNEYTCKSYKDMSEVNTNAPVVTGTRTDSAGTTTVVKQDELVSPADRSDKVDLATFKRICPPSKPALLGSEVCKTGALLISENAKIDKTGCAAAVNTYPKATREVKALTAQIDSLTDTVKILKKQMSDARRAAVDEIKESLRERTEGGVCLECLAENSGYFYEKRETDWPGVTANILTGLMGVYTGYKTNQMVADYNSSIGFGTQPNSSAYMMGFPYIMNGIYGAMGGGMGMGGFGCGSSMGGGGNWNGANGMLGPFGMGGLYNPAAGGMWGYPQGMVGAGLSGGMFNPGMGPWGMNGPWGVNPYGMGMYPGGGMAISGGFGFQMPGHGNYPWMMNGGIPGMGIPMMGMQMSSGMPMMGMAINGGMAMNAGMPMMGMQMSSGMPMMGMQMNSGMAGMFDQSGMQMQQQMMQLQMQQYQMQAQQQQRYYENYMQRQRALSGLQQELMGLMNRIQMVQSGGLNTYNSGLTGGGYLGVGGTLGIGGSLGVGGTISTPAPIGGSHR